MDIQKLIHEVGGDVERKRAIVEIIERRDGDIIWMKVRLLNPSALRVDHIATWYVKAHGEDVRCILGPPQTPVYVPLEFWLQHASVFPPESMEKTSETILREVSAGDELVVLHIYPALHAGKYAPGDSVEESS